jgi:hypothetical protein
VTDFTNKIKILGAFYSNYRDDDDELEEFFEFNDIGAPLAYLSSEGLCEVSDDGKKYIAETWDILLTFLGIEDVGFNTLEELLLKAKLEE